MGPVRRSVSARDGTLEVWKGILKDGLNVADVSCALKAWISGCGRCGIEIRNGGWVGLDGH